eukprot:Em0026g35a
MRLKCPTIRFVPNKARQAFARAFSAALMAVISENTVTAWLKLFMLPKCVLPTAKRGGHHNKPVPIESLCAMWAEGQFRDLWHLAKARAPCSKKQRVPSDETVKKRVNSAISLAQDGLFGKACQVLVSPGLAPNNDETWKLLVAKHPECPCPSVLTLPSMDTAIPHDLNLKAVLRSFPKLTSAGPSGLRIQHIIDASEVPLQTPILQCLRAIINLLAAGSAPSEVSTFLASGSLTALNKSKPVWCCLSNGAEKIAHGLRACVNKYWLDDDFVVLKVDMKNAFNMVSREAILSECSKHFPELLPWSTWCYSQHPILWHPLGSLHSEQGVQQGDPLGPLLFSLVLNKAVTANPVCAELSYHAWYLDDGVLAGPRPAVLQALSIIQEIGPPNGLIAFCSTFISEKHEEAKALLLKLEEVSGGDVVTCHNKLRDTLAETCRRAHLSVSVKVEAGSNLTKDHSHTRPADSYSTQLVYGSNRAKAEVLAALYGRLNLNLVRANATAILSRCFVPDCSKAA